MAKRYDHKALEKKWQKVWDKKRVYRTLPEGKKKKMYVLDMFPYPSGAGLHVGHPRGYIGTDVYSRMKRMQGFNVLHPMGYDAFGLPAEQYAIQHNIHPEAAVKKNVATFERQLSIIGLSFDWSRKVNTTDPTYYKWTQWIFIKLFESWYDKKKNTARPIKELVAAFAKRGNSQVVAVSDTVQQFSAKEWRAFSKFEQEQILMKYRLTYEGYSEVNWSPDLGTVLANDEIIEGKNGELLSERGNHPVEKKQMRQWFMRITAYADRLLAGLETVNWQEHIKEIQRNWIGKSEGGEFTFKLRGVPYNISIFTTRPDTIMGVTYLVIAPEHPLVKELLKHVENREQVENYVKQAAKKSEADRTDAKKEKTGVLLGNVTAINPVNGEEVTVWVADYVLADYGTGAIMAVPAHDARDKAFAEQYNLPIKEVIDEKGVVINSGRYNGLTSSEATKKIIDEFGIATTKYKMRDAIFARQRYWGEPIPLIHKPDGTITAVSEKKLPLKLPPIKSYEPIGTGESPLAGVHAWIKAGYETNTMPGWAGSSWYFLRYMDPKNKKALASKRAIKYWKNVDVYVGGAEHATGHLLYSRFWHKFLLDIGVVTTEEPFQTMKNQGLITATDGRKMSKRWGNVVNPDDVVKNYGADTLRVYEMFMGPFEQQIAWSTESIIGSRRFIEKVWKLTEKVKGEKETSEHNRRLLHQTIKKVSEDIEAFSFNTAISSMMIFVNELNGALAEKDFILFIKLLAPFAPHITEELWSMFKQKGTIHLSDWPTYSEKELISSTVTLAVQINGKIRDTITIARDAKEKEVLSLVKDLVKIKPYLEGKKVIKTIVIPNRVVNIVVK